MAGASGEGDLGDAGDVWQWGVETSRLMGERLLDLYSQVGTATFERLRGNGSDEVRQVRRDMERWVDLSVELFDRAFSVMRRLDGDANTNGDRGPVDQLTMIGMAGAACIAELWLHNLSDDERGAPVLRATGLLSAAGWEIPAAAVRVDVERAPLDGRGRRSVSVIVDIPGSTPAGIYHGQILSEASPDRPVALRVDVRRA